MNEQTVFSYSLIINFEQTARILCAYLFFHCTKLGIVGFEVVPIFAWPVNGSLEVPQRDLVESAQIKRIKCTNYQITLFSFEKAH